MAGAELASGRDLYAERSNTRALATHGRVLLLSATERKGSDVTGFKVFRLQNGQNLASTVYCVLNSLDRGLWTYHLVPLPPLHA